MANYTNKDIKELADLIRIRSEDNKKISFITGAGCSKSAGIPLANEFVARINSENKYSYYIRNLSVEEKKEYGKCMAKLAENTRRELINDYLAGAKLNWGHIALASMIANGYVKRVLTLNFDNILIKACGLCGVYPATYDYALSAPTTSSHIVEPAIIYLHGQGHGLIMLNTDEETKTHSKLIRPIVVDTLERSEVIVIGYSGKADNVFGVIEEEYDNKEYLFWCSYKEKPDNHVKKLQKSKTVIQHFGGVDSDDFLVQLAQELGCFPPKIFAKPIDHLRDEIEDIVPFKLQESGSLDVKASLEVKLAAFDKVTISSKGEFELQDLLLEGNTSEIIRFAEQGKYKKTDVVSDIYNQAYFTEGLKTKDVKEKARLYKKAHNYDKDDYHSLANWAAALVELGENELSIKKIKLAVKIFSKGSAIYNTWGAALLQLERNHEAIEKFKMAVELYPNFVDALVNWGHALGKLGYQEEAIAKYNEALEIDQEDFSALYGQAASLLELKQYEAAKVLLDKALEISPGNAYNMACYMAATDRPEECKKYLEICNEAGTLPGREYLQNDETLEKVKETQWFKNIVAGASDNKYPFSVILD